MDYAEAIEAYPASFLVHVESENLRAALRDEILKNGGEHPRELRCNNCLISNLSGIKYFRRLELLDLCNRGDEDINEICDISEIRHLANLQTLDLSGNRCLESIDALQGLTSLLELFLGFTGITDLAPIAGLTRLKHLSIAANSIDDLSPIANLDALEILDLRYVFDWEKADYCLPLVELARRRGERLTIIFTRYFQPSHEILDALRAEGVNVVLRR